MLEPVGITPAEEELFRRLLDSPRTTAAELAAALGLPRSALPPLLDALERRGLVVPLPGMPTRYLPSAPDLALEQLVLERQEELDRVRAVARELSAHFRRTLAHRPAELGEVLTGREAVAHAARQLERSAREVVLATVRPPQELAPAHEAGPPAREREPEVLRLYHRRALDDADQLAVLERRLAAGEQARVLRDVPMVLLVVDHCRALVPLDQDTPSYEAAMLVRAQPLVDALVWCFRCWWDRAVAIRAAEPGAIPGDDRVARPGPQDRQLLTLLAAGLKDEAAARQLGLSSRTIVRRVDRMMKQLGADTRFQAGLQAARKGWL